MSFFESWERSSSAINIRLIHHDESQAGVEDWIPDELGLASTRLVSPSCESFDTHCDQRAVRGCGSRADRDRATRPIRRRPADGEGTQPRERAACCFAGASAQREAYSVSLNAPSVPLVLHALAPRTPVPARSCLGALSHDGPLQTAQL